MNDVLKGFLIAAGVFGVLVTIGFFAIMSSITFAEEHCYDPGLKDLNPILIGQDLCIFGDSDALYSYSVTCDGSTVLWYSDDDVFDRDMTGIEDCEYEKTVLLENFK